MTRLWTTKIYVFVVILACQISFSKSETFDILVQSTETEKLGCGDFNIEWDGEWLLMKHFLKAGDVVFDVGANTGEWSTFALKAQPKIKLLAFEPLPEVVDQLNKKLKQKKGIKIYNLALSDQVGHANFFYYHYPQQDSGLSGFFYREVLRGDHHEPDTITVKQTTLDAFCATHGISKINFLKIDTEGAEWKVLNGAKSMLKNHHIRAIQFEYGGCYIDAKTTLEQVTKFLTEYKYIIFRVMPKGLVYIPQWSNSLENYIISNYFAIRAEDMPSYKLMLAQ